MSACKCNVGLGNTGLPNCVPIASVTKKIVVVPLYDNNGVRNFVDCTATLNEAYFTARINDIDKSKRWFPLPEIKNIEDAKAESIFEGFNDGSNIFIQEGVRTFNGLLPNQTPEFLGQLKEARCVKIGVYMIDSNGNLIGNGKEDEKLYPIAVDNSSWNPILVKTTDTTVQKIQLSFEYSRIERDEDLRMIVAEEIIDYDLLKMKGLVDIKLKNLAVQVATDTISFIANTIFGSLCTPVVIQGLDLVDFAVTRNGVPLVLNGVAEATAGSYVLATATDLQIGDVIVVNTVKYGFEVISGNKVTA